MAVPTAKSPPRCRRVTGKEDELTAKEARRILRAAMVSRGYSFKMLAEALADQQGARPMESVQSLTNKVNRGRFSFAFFLRAARAMEIDSIDLTVGQAED